MHVVFRFLATIVSTIAAFMSTPLLAQIPQELRPWLDSPQEWSRDTDGRVLSIGETGEFASGDLLMSQIKWSVSNSLAPDLSK